MFCTPSPPSTGTRTTFPTPVALSRRAIVWSRTIKAHTVVYTVGLAYTYTSTAIHPQPVRHAVSLLGEALQLGRGGVGEFIAHKHNQTLSPAHTHSLSHKRTHTHTLVLCTLLLLSFSRRSRSQVAQHGKAFASEVRVSGSVARLLVSWLCGRCGLQRNRL